jgi:hypothetical protein
MNTNLNNKSNGFLDCMKVLAIQPAGNGGYLRVRDNKVYNYDLYTYKVTYDKMCDCIDDKVSYQGFLNWMNDTQLRTDLNAQDELNAYANYKAEKAAENAQKIKTEQLVEKYRAAYENACNDLYYGYGYSFWWNTHKKYIENEADAKIIWQAAFNKMATTD